MIAAGLEIAAVSRASLNASLLAKEAVVLGLTPPIPQISSPWYTVGALTPRLDLSRIALELK